VKSTNHLCQYKKITKSWSQFDASIPLPSLTQWQQSMRIVNGEYADETCWFEQEIALKAIESTMSHLGMCNLSLVNLTVTVSLNAHVDSTLALGTDAFQLSRLVGSQLGLNDHYRERMQWLIYYFSKKPEQIVDMDGIVANYIPQQRLTLALDDLISELKLIVGTAGLSSEMAIAMLNGAGALMIGSAICTPAATHLLIGSAKDHYLKRNTFRFCGVILKWTSRVRETFRWTKIHIRIARRACTHAKKYR
jgi:hypothetical protein